MSAPLLLEFGDRDCPECGGHGWADEYFNDCDRCDGIGELSERSNPLRIDLDRERREAAWDERRRAHLRAMNRAWRRTWPQQSGVWYQQSTCRTHQRGVEYVYRLPSGTESIKA